MKTKSGSILILTTWVLSLLTIFAIGLGCNISSQINFASYFRNRLMTHYLSVAGIERAIVELSLDETDAYDALDSGLTNNKEIFKDIQLDSGSFTVSYELEDKNGKKNEVLYGLMDESSKININHAPAEILGTLLEVIGETRKGEETDIANAIIDWRDEDIVPSLRGAEDDYYRSLDLPYDCKDAKFQIVEELLLVRGMTPEIFSRIKDLITVYGEGQININTASLPVFQALGLEENFAERIIEHRQGNDETTGTEDDNIFESVGDIRDVGPLFTEESIALNHLISLNILSVKSDVFRINSYGIIKNRGRELKRKTVCVVERKDEEDAEILYWREE